MWMDCIMPSSCSTMMQSVLPALQLAGLSRLISLCQLELYDLLLPSDAAAAGIALSPLSALLSLEALSLEFAGRKGKQETRRIPDTVPQVG